MLALVEHDTSSFTDMGWETMQWIMGLCHKPERPRDRRCWDELGIGQRGQIDEEKPPRQNHPTACG